jgi:hypothetical protein
MILALKRGRYCDKQDRDGARQTTGSHPKLISMLHHMVLNRCVTGGYCEAGCCPAPQQPRQQAT